MTSRAQNPLVRGRSHWRKFDFSALRCEQMQNEKRASDDETKTHSITNPDVQFKFSLTKQKTRPRTDYEWIGKTIYKKSDPKNRKYTRQIAEKDCRKIAAVDSNKHDWD